MFHSFKKRFPGWSVLHPCMYYSNDYFMWFCGDLYSKMVWCGGAVWRDMVIYGMVGECWDWVFGMMGIIVLARRVSGCDLDYQTLKKYPSGHPYTSVIHFVNSQFQANDLSYSTSI